MVQAQDFSLTPLEPDLDLNHLPSGVKVHTTQNRVEKRYLSVEKRDQS